MWLDGLRLIREAGREQTSHTCILDLSAAMQVELLQPGKGALVNPRDQVALGEDEACEGGGRDHAAGAGGVAQPAAAGEVEVPEVASPHLHPCQLGAAWGIRMLSFGPTPAGTDTTRF